MGLAQENFDRAVRSAKDTILALRAAERMPVELSRENPQTLRSILWDLEAIGAAIRLELMNREDKNPMDLG